MYQKPLKKYVEPGIPDLRNYHYKLLKFSFKDKM